MAPAFLTRLKRSRLVRGIGANVYGQVAQTALQLLSVPILASHWGLQTYGAWLVIFTVPNYLAFADFGFASAAANDMTASIARGDRASAVETFQAVRAAMFVICAILLVACALVAYAIPDRSLAFVPGVSHDQARRAILMVACYGVLSVQNSVSLAAFRSIGKYATGTYLQATINFVENIGALAIVSAGGNIEAAAATYLLIGVLGIAVRMVWLWVQARWLVFFSGRISLRQVRRLLHPAVAVLVLPLAQALSLQGVVAVIGMAAGAAAVPAFTAVRTLSRVGLQLTLIVSSAVLPEFTMAAASADHARRARLAFMSIASSAVILLPMFLVVVAGGPSLLKLWTGGVIHAPYALIVCMGLTMVVNGTWLPIANLILALNRHSQYSYYYLAAAAGCMLVSYPMVRWLGSPGASVSLLAADSIMLVRVWTRAMALEIFDPRELYQTAIGTWAQLRSALASYASRKAS